MIGGGRILRVILVIIIILIDQMTKRYIDIRYEKYNEEHKFWRLYFIKVYNYGAAYGFLKNKKKLLMVMTSMAIFLLVGMMFYLGGEEYIVQIGLTCILAGALGNLLDRIRYGYVIDYIYIKTKMKKAPIFNIADIAILVGFLIVLFYDISLCI